MNTIQDPRNLVNIFKGRSEQDIIDELDKNGVSLEVAVENIERDFNMGTIVRNANAFGARQVHVVGRRQWNKRGAMMTDKYLHVHYYESVAEFAHSMSERQYIIIAIDNVDGAVSLSEARLPKKAVLVFGSERDGLSEVMQRVASQVVAIEQFGSTRSVNVGVASGIAMYAWLQQHHLS